MGGRSWEERRTEVGGGGNIRAGEGWGKVTYCRAVRVKKWLFLRPSESLIAQGPTRARGLRKESSFSPYSVVGGLESRDR